MVFLISSLFSFTQLRFFFSYPIIDYIRIFQNRSNFPNKRYCLGSLPKMFCSNVASRSEKGRKFNDDSNFDGIVFFGMSNDSRRNYVGKFLFWATVSSEASKLTALWKDTNEDKWVLNNYRHENHSCVCARLQQRNFCQWIMIGARISTAGSKLCRTQANELVEKKKQWELTIVWSSNDL